MHEIHGEAKEERMNGLILALIWGIGKECLLMKSAGFGSCL